jgi:hypothetical protein
MNYDLQRFDRPSRANMLGAAVVAVVFVVSLIAFVDAILTHSAGAEWAIHLISGLARG